MKVLMVCLGNICRSPLAQGILEKKVQEHGLDWQLDSAGTSAWHVGEKPDTRSIKTAKKYGLDITKQRARQFSEGDFDEFDVIYAMDTENLKKIKSLATNVQQEGKVKLILSELNTGESLDVPDPYWDNRFDQVYQMLSDACENIILKHSNK